MNISGYRRAILGVAMGVLLTVLPAIAFADTPNTTSNSLPNTVSNGGNGFSPNTTSNNNSYFPGTAGNPTVNNGTGPSTCGTGPCVVGNPLGSTTSLCGLLKELFQAVVAIAIPIAVLFIIWSGFQFVLAQGNPKKLATARKNFYYTIFGIAIFLGAWLLATVIASTINAIGGSNIISCQ